MNNSKKISKSLYVKIVVLILCAVLVPATIYHIELYQLRKAQDELRDTLEQKITKDVKSYLNDVAFSENVVYNVTTDTISQDSQDAFEGKVAKIVKDTVNNEEDTLDGDLVNKIMAKVDSLVMARFSELEEKEFNTLLNSIEAIVLADVEDYVSKVMTTYQNTDNMYSHINFVSGNYETRIANLEEKLYALQNAYNDKLSNLDSDVSAQLKALRSETTSLKSLNEQLKKEIDKLDTESESGDKEVLNSLVQLQNNLTDIQNYDDERIYKNTTEIIKLYESLQSTQDDLNDVISVILDGGLDNSEEIISTLNDIAAQLRETDAYIMNKVSETDADLAAELKAEREAREKAINDTTTTLTNSINETNTNLTNNINETKESLTNSINETNTTLTDSINSTKETLTNSINTTRTDLTTYIDAENLQTREDLAQAIVMLQQEIADLQSQLDTLNAEKLNIVDSTYYDVDTSDGTTGINITIPQTNPNLTSN